MNETPDLSADEAVKVTAFGLDRPDASMEPEEAAWRKAIADQVRANCTIDWDIVQKGGDVLVYAVCDWIENPPEWSVFHSPGDSKLTPFSEYWSRVRTDETWREQQIAGRAWYAAMDFAGDPSYIAGGAIPSFRTGVR